MTTSDGATLVNCDTGRIVGIDDDGITTFYSYRLKRNFSIPLVKYTSEWVTDIGYVACPFIQGAAITVHKAQGATLEAGIIFETRTGLIGDAYLAHKLYTAFSRVKKISDIRITSYLLDLLDTPLIQKKLDYIWKLDYMRKYIRLDSYD
jgi:hypothetical protein